MANQWKIQSDGNGGFNVGKALFVLLITVAGAVGLTTGDIGDFFDGPNKVRRIERIEVELDHLSAEFRRHVQANIEERRDAAKQVDKRLDDMARRLDAIYQILVDRNGDG